MENPSIALSMFAFPDFQDYETVPFATFTVDMANGAEKLSLQLSGIVIDEVEQPGFHYLPPRSQVDDDSCWP